MNPLGGRSRVEELARLLDGAVAGPGSATAGQAALASRLRALAPSLEDQVAPRPEFRAALRQRLVAVATVQAAAAYAEPAGRTTALDAAVSWSQSRKAQRRLGVTAGAMASVVALAGVGIASSRSLPGQPFYGLKRASEGAQLDFASGDTAKGAKHLEFAKTRLREVRALAAGDGMLSLGPSGTTGVVAGGSVASRIVDTLEDFTSQTRDGQSLLEKAYRASGKTEPLTILKTFASTQQDQLTSLLPTLPAATKVQAQQALELVFSVGSSANELLALGSCGGSCDPGNGGATPPTAPDPTPGATAVPTPDDSNGGQDCPCASSPEPTVEPQPSPTPEPTDSPSPSASPAPEPTAAPTSAPSPSPSPSPSSPLPLPLPTGLLPTGLPTLPPLPLPSGFPTLLPTAVPTLPVLPLTPQP